MTIYERFFNDFADVVRPEVDNTLDTAILTLLEFFGDLESVTEPGTDKKYSKTIGEDVLLEIFGNVVDVHNTKTGEWFSLELHTSAEMRHKNAVERVAVVGRELWYRLTDSEQEYYLNECGTIEFVDRVIELLNYRVEDFSIDDIEHLLTEVIMSDIPKPVTMGDSARERLFGLHSIRTLQENNR